jgi:hypothetical protein
VVDPVMLKVAIDASIRFLARTFIRGLVATGCLILSLALFIGAFFTDGWDRTNWSNSAVGYSSSSSSTSHYLALSPSGR